MKLEMFAVRDRKADCFFTPMFLNSKGQAIRAFGDEINKRADGNLLNMHPSDFDLYFLGWFDTDAGTFEIVSTGPSQIAIGEDLLLKD